MTLRAACCSLLEDAGRAPGPTLTLQELLLPWPDYAVTAIVASLSLAALTGQVVRCATVSRAPADAQILQWPMLSLITPPAVLAAVVAPPPPSPQVLRITSVPQLDALIGLLSEEYVSRGGANLPALYVMLQEAGRNALRWSADRAAFVGWGWPEEHFELAIGDAGPGIPFVARRFAPSNVLRSVLIDERDERGLASHGLTWMHDQLTTVYNRQGYIVSGDQLHDCVSHVESFVARPSIPSLGPTVVAARV